MFNLLPLNKCQRKPWPKTRNRTSNNFIQFFPLGTRCIMPVSLQPQLKRAYCEVLKKNTLYCDVYYPLLAKHEGMGPWEMYWSAFRWKFRIFVAATQRRTTTDSHCVPKKDTASTKLFIYFTFCTTASSSGVRLRMAKFSTKTPSGSMHQTCLVTAPGIVKNIMEKILH